MEPTPRLFRGMIIGSLGAAVVGVVIHLAFPDLIPERLRVADENWTDGMSMERLLLISAASFVFAIAGIAGVVGLYLFKPWALQLNLYLVIASLAMAPIYGYTLAAGWSQALYDLGSLMWGAILAMAYWTPLRERFRS